MSVSTHLVVAKGELEMEKEVDVEVEVKMEGGGRDRDGERSVSRRGSGTQSHFLLSHQKCRLFIC